VVGVDRWSNVALLQVEGAKLRALHPAPPQSVATGAWVAVISNIAITRPQAALGQIVGRGERIDYPHSGEILEIDAPSYPGSTGGAVVNEEGDWVAVVVGRALRGSEADRSRVGAARGQLVPDNPASVLIALPVEHIGWLTKELETYGSVRHGFLGVQLRRGNPALSESLGVLVSGVIADSPADSAGLRAGDRILAIQGQEARTADELTAFVRTSRPGDVVEVTVLRQAEIFPLLVTVGAAFQQPPVGPRPSTAADVRRMKRELQRLQADQRRLEEQLRALEGTPQQ
jgi:serine protease Do